MFLTNNYFVIIIMILSWRNSWSFYLANKVIIINVLDLQLFSWLSWRNSWSQAVMSLYGGGQMTGVAVDSGQVCLVLFCFFSTRFVCFFSQFFSGQVFVLARIEVFLECEMLILSSNSEHVKTSKAHENLIQDTTYIVPAYQGNPIQVLLQWS